MNRQNNITSAKCFCVWSESLKTLKKIFEKVYLLPWWCKIRGRTRQNASSQMTSIKIMKMRSTLKCSVVPKLQTFSHSLLPRSHSWRFPSQKIDHLVGFVATCCSFFLRYPPPPRSAQCEPPPPHPMKDNTTYFKNHWHRLYSLWECNELHVVSGCWQTCISGTSWWSRGLRQSCRYLQGDREQKSIQISTLSNLTIRVWCTSLMPIVKYIKKKEKKTFWIL